LLDATVVVERFFCEINCSATKLGAENYKNVRRRSWQAELRAKRYVRMFFGALLPTRAHAHCWGGRLAE
jgi:hypothetical protein